MKEKEEVSASGGREREGRAKGRRGSTAGDKTRRAMQAATERLGRMQTQMPYRETGGARSAGGGPGARGEDGARKVKY